MAPGGSASPESAKRHKNSVIIASPFITSEVPVGLAVTLFSLSPKRVKNRLARTHNCQRWDAKTRVPWGPWALGTGLWETTNEPFSPSLNPMIGRPPGRNRRRNPKPDTQSLAPKAQTPNAEPSLCYRFPSNGSPVLASDQTERGEKSPPRPDRLRTAGCLRQ